MDVYLLPTAMPAKDLFDHIREGDLSEFRPQSENARIHPARAIGMLEKSINKVGWLGAVTVAADGEAFDGSLRLETIATALDGAKPIVVDVDGTRPVIVRRTDIPNADNPLAREASVWANRVAEASEWDKAVLADWGLAGDIDLGELWTVEELAGWGESDDPSISDALAEELDGFSDAADAMESGSLQGLIIEFEQDDYSSALSIIKELRKRGVYVGGLVLEALRDA
jgi:hypothetical protein